MIFTPFGRRRSELSVDAQGGELSEAVRQILPHRFEAVAEALASAVDTRPACAVVGRDVARDGAALGEALDGLRTTFDLVIGVEPDFASVEALSLAWSESTLEFLHDLSCEDPLTGLASLAHLRTRLDEVYREAEQTAAGVASTHALVVVELSAVGGLPPPAEHRFVRALHLVRVAETVRSVFAGDETVARVGGDRVVVLVRRGALGPSFAVLRELLAGVDLGGPGTRLWIEGLPAQATSARRLLGELAR